MGYNRHNAPPILSRYVEDANGCWIYQGEIGRYGYGVVSFGQRRDGNRVRIVAHRYFYEQLVEAVPRDLNVCHKCDVRACVNPSHMFIGTQADNLNDMRKKGREGRAGAVGERNHFARLSAREAKAILEAEGTQASIAERYGVAHATVQAIKARRLWKHI